MERVFRRAACGDRSVTSGCRLARAPLVRPSVARRLINSLASRSLGPRLCRGRSFRRRASIERALIRSSSRPPSLDRSSRRPNGLPPLATARQRSSGDEKQTRAAETPMNNYVDARSFRPARHVRRGGLAGEPAAFHAAALSSPGWTRTNNPPVNSRMLCQLSYRGTVLSGPKCSRDRGAIQVELDRVDRSVQTDARASPYVLRSAPQAAPRPDLPLLRGLSRAVLGAPSCAADRRRRALGGAGARAGAEAAPRPSRRRFPR